MSRGRPRAGGLGGWRQRLPAHVPAGASRGAPAPGAWAGGPL